jgi:hypothetical protein
MCGLPAQPVVDGRWNLFGVPYRSSGDIGWPLRLPEWPKQKCVWYMRKLPGRQDIYERRLLHKLSGESDFGGRDGLFQLRGQLLFKFGRRYMYGLPGISDLEPGWVVWFLPSRSGFFSGRRCV